MFNHDESLLCWYNEKNRLKVEDFFLITIDKHQDLKELSNDIKQPLLEIKNIYNLRKIIETQFDPTNVNFILAAMELGIVKNALIFSPT